MIRWRHVVVFVAVVLAACAGTPQLAEVKEVTVCAASDCGPASQRYSASEMLRRLYELIKQNEGTEYVICSSTRKAATATPRAWAISSWAVRFPGAAVPEFRGRYTNVQRDAASHVVTATASNQLLFIGTPLACADTKHTPDGAFGGRDRGHGRELLPTAWAGVGNMTASFNYVVDYVDLDRAGSAVGGSTASPAPAAARARATPSSTAHAEGRELAQDAQR